MSFTNKLLTVTLDLAAGKFSGGGNTTTIANLRMSATIISVGGASSGNMELAIYGLPLTLMNQMSTVGTQLDQQDKNKISVQAGDAQSGQTLVFQGLIHNAFVDAQAMPQVCFRISAVPGGGYWAVEPVPPISLPGSQDVAGMMGKLAGQMGLTLENNGVNVKLVNPYYPGSPWTQAVRIAKHANIEMVVDKGVLAISPAGTPRNGSSPMISPTSMPPMVGYPAFRQAGIIVKSQFNPAVKVNGTIQVQSSLTPANGTWMVTRIVYELESLMPHGRWFQTMEATLAKGNQDPA